MSPNLQQLAVIESTASTVAVCATAGAGKTATLAARIRRQHALYPTAHRVVLTFTNSAARELHERLDGTPVGFIGTLHAYCFGLLQRHGELIGYRAGGINLMTEEQSRDMLAEVAVTLGYATKTGDKLKWRTGMSMKALERAQDPWAMAIWREYHHRLKRNNMVDYDRVLEAAHELLQWSDQLRPIDELYVDECQDSSDWDWKLYTGMPVRNWMFIGDGDQSVYGWRGAKPEKYLAILRRLGDKVHVLDHCYRCGTAICEAASRLIAHNTDRIPHDVVPSEHRDSLIEVTAYDDDREERAGVCRLVARCIELGTPPEQIAVLVRRNDLAQQFRESLECMGLLKPRPASELPRDWGFALDCLSMLNDPANDLVTERVLRSEAGGFTSERIQSLRLIVAESGLPLSSEASKLGILQIPFGPFPVDQFLSRNCVSREAVALVSERIKLLPEFSLPALLHDLYGSDKWAPKQEPGIFCGTAHSAKGKEFDVVFAPCLEEGVFPSLREGVDISEERRLMFVVMTRARSALYVSWSRKRFAWGKVSEQTKSRFITQAFES